MKNKKNILIASVLVLAALIPLSAYFIKTGTTLIEVEAEAETTPKNLKISQLSSNSFTVEWTTEAEFLGYIKYGPSPEETNFIGQDIKGNSRFIEHTIIISNLEPNTTYYYVVVSEQDTYQKNGETFEVTTIAE